MEVLIILIPVALVLSCMGLLAFFWTIKNKQYDDMQRSAQQILLDDEDGNSEETDHK